MWGIIATDLVQLIEDKLEEFVGILLTVPGECLAMGWVIIFEGEVRRFNLRYFLAMIYKADPLARTLDYPLWSVVASASR